MFPALRVSFSGLDPKSRYIILLDILPVDNKRYRYAYHRSSWLVAGKADPPIKNRLYLHPDSPYTGEHLSKQMISFEKVKLTNNALDNQGHVSVNGIAYSQNSNYDGHVLMVVSSPPPFVSTPPQPFSSPYKFGLVCQ